MDIKERMKFLHSFIKPQVGNITVAGILEIITIICSVSIPYFLADMISNLEGKHVTIEVLLKNFFIVVMLYCIWDVCNVIIDIRFSIINKTIENNIRSFCYERIFNSKTILVEKESEGEIINKLLKDTERLEKAFFNVFYFIVSIIHIIAIILAMLRISVLATVIISTLFVILILLQKMFSSQLKENYSKYKVSEEYLFKDLKNFIAGFMNIKILGLEKKCISILNQRNIKNLNNYKKLEKISSIYTNLNFFVLSIFRVSSLLVGGIIYITSKAIHIGDIFAIYTYAIQLTTQLKTIVEINITLKDMEISLDRILNFINKFESSDDVIDSNFRIHNISAKGINFKYNQNYIFKNMQFNIEKNDIVAIKGRNGSGKTSLVKLICGFYNVENLFINEIAQDKLSEKQILSRVAYVPQNIYLFPGTIMDNISCFGKKTKEYVYKICKDLNIHEKILSLNDGYNTIINDKNLNLSGGEKQIISIARALLKDSDILVLDEINSALDFKMEENIINNIRKYYKNKIVLIISHKDKILEECNKIIDIDQFKVY